jgi:hypothetical protein
MWNSLSIHSYCSPVCMLWQAKTDCWEDKMARQERSCNVRLDSRCQDENGEIRRKRGDTLVGTLRDTYGEQFAPGYRSDTKLETLLERERVSSLSQLLKRDK